MSNEQSRYQGKPKGRRWPLITAIVLFHVLALYGLAQIPAQAAVEKNVDRAFAEPIVGGGANGCILHYVENRARLQDGDLVLTSGLGGNLPPNLVVGQVTSSRAGLDVYQIAQVRSLIDFDALESVLVITNFQPVDLSAFQQTGGN